MNCLEVGLFIVDSIFKEILTTNFNCSTCKFVFETDKKNFFCCFCHQRKYFLPLLVIKPVVFLNIVFFYFFFRLEISFFFFFFFRKYTNDGPERFVQAKKKAGNKTRTKCCQRAMKLCCGIWLDLLEEPYTVTRGKVYFLWL